MYEANTWRTPHTIQEKGGVTQDLGMRMVKKGRPVPWVSEIVMLQCNTCNYMNSNKIICAMITLCDYILSDIMMQLCIF
jgi:hypothetical protein